MNRGPVGTLVLGIGGRIAWAAVMFVDWLSARVGPSEASLDDADRDDDGSYWS